MSSSYDELILARKEDDIRALRYMSTPLPISTDEYYTTDIRHVLDEIGLKKRCCRAFVVARTRVNECSVCHAKIDMSVYDIYDSKIPVMRK
jgi:hypothetical protein